MGWLPHLRRSLIVRRLGGALALTAALVLCRIPASGGISWDIGMGIGYIAIALVLTLYLYPLRGDGLPHRRLFTLSHHRRIGWTVLYLSGLHVAVLLGAEPLVWQYLRPSTPFYMLAGLLGLIALGLLVATGLSGRKALRQPHPPGTSLSLHALLSPALLLLLAAHLLGSAQLVDSPIKVVTGCLLLCIPLLWIAYRAMRHGKRRPLTTAVPCLLAVTALAVLPTPTASSRLLEPMMTPAPVAVHFPHEKHTSTNCVVCHHNFVDKTGIGSCLDCHRSPRTDLARAAEATFHTFCRNCHTELAHTTTRHGPTRACSVCHGK
jgi:hypothetical protein